MTSCLRDLERDGLVGTLAECAYRVQSAVAESEDWSTPGPRATQYEIDLVADEVAIEFLLHEGFDVVSEESGHQGRGSEITVVVDPVDGTANAVRGLPSFATSLCAVDHAGARAAVVLDLSSGTTYNATRGLGARADGHRLHVTDCERLPAAFVGYSGLPSDGRARWSQGRAVGSLALALCHVGSGVFDGFVDLDPNVHGPWDYLGGLLIATESGAVACDAFERPLMTCEHTARRSPIVAGTNQLLDALRRVPRPNEVPQPAQTGSDTAVPN
jgi:fructose-1,6-bisphosphatase/inositol monophosphatase family enzyme